MFGKSTPIERRLQPRTAGGQIEPVSCDHIERLVNDRLPASAIRYRMHTDSGLDAGSMTPNFIQRWLRGLRRK